MALAFFTAPALPALFGFGTTATPARPDSMSAEAIIKCSDCGGDVVLAQLGEHVCLPPDQQEQAQSDQPNTDTSTPLEPVTEEPVEQPDTHTNSANPTGPPTTPPSKFNPSSSGSSTASSSRSSILSSASRVSSSTTTTSQSTGPKASPSNTPARQSTGPKASPSSSPARQPTHSPSSSQSSTSLNLLKEKLLNSIRPEPPKPAQSNSEGMLLPQAMTSSTASISNSSDTSFSSSQSSSSAGRVPFFERYAQLTKTSTPVSATQATPKAIPKPQKKAAPAPISKKPLTPITSPESSPVLKKPQPPPVASSSSSQPKMATSKSMPFSNLPAVGLASQRREALNRGNDKHQLPHSSSASSGLHKYTAREHEKGSTARTNMLGRIEESTKGLTSALSSSSLSKPRGGGGGGGGGGVQPPSSTGLEDLMGDLMAEMEKKAEQSSEEYQKRTGRHRYHHQNRHPPDHTVLQKIQVPDSTPRKAAPSSRVRDGYEARTPDHHFRKGSYGDSHTPKLHERHASSEGWGDSGSPSSPGIRPSDSISQLGYGQRSPSPKPVRGLVIASRGNADAGRHAPAAAKTVCQRCFNAPIRRRKTPPSSTNDALGEHGGENESQFCSGCYAELYLPKCRKCAQPIERGAVTDRVGKVLGKYHASCFNCYQCNAPFPNGEFYVWERKPVCCKHYHRLAGTICSHQACGRGIEGACVSLTLDGSQTGSMGSEESGSTLSNNSRRKLYHPEHFCCSRMGCSMSLHEYHFVINQLPWCERHAKEEEQQAILRSLNHHPHHPAAVPSHHLPHYYPHPASHVSSGDGRSRMANQQQPPVTRRLERRRTIVQNVRTR
ncbi:hypothetical protein PCASD_23259 [Puccinia coronata f. sp. avenae]|uniref:LIM zinc-binding domain-containing protein n=1 Tax=Puccinia coronata f. sp. avenae TaxID=200324 RepID=A0A2N5S4P8_9BASI|nr:hypothetical protein PCASD_23259 [Puccinia coronata f. sp. avenae]